MSYAKVENGVVTKYPYSQADLQRDNPNTSYPANMPSAALATLGVLWVYDSDIPPHDANTQTVDEVAPEFVNGRVERRWTVRNLTAQELKARVPAQVTMRQARLALLQYGVLAQVNAALAAMPGAEGEAARIEWEYAQEVRRDAPLVAGMAQALWLTEADLDSLFILGAKL